MCACVLGSLMSVLLPLMRLALNSFFLLLVKIHVFSKFCFFLIFDHPHHRTHQRRTGVPFVATKVKQLKPLYSLNSTQQTHTEMYECVRINSANLNSAAISVTQTNSTAVSQ